MVRVTVVVLVNAPEIPAIVTVAGPVAAVFEAVNVKTLEAVVELGLKEAVTPLGRPEADRSTVPLKPFCGAIVTVTFPAVPCTTLKLVGNVESVKLPGEITARLIVVELVRPPETPVTVTVALPSEVELLAVKVSVLVVCALVGLKEAVTPAGRPEAEKVTLPVKPFQGVTTTAVLAVDPCLTLTLLAKVERVKVGWVPGQLLTKLAALSEPMPVAKSQPVVAS
jgi:hypothetical protein